MFILYLVSVLVLHISCKVESIHRGVVVVVVVYPCMEMSQNFCMLFGHLFVSSVLNVVVPDTSIEYPPQSTPDAWLTWLQLTSVERKQAFFGE